MKVNLLRNSPDVLNGYLNIDPFHTGGPDKVVGDLQDLDYHVSAAEAQELLAYDVRDFIEPESLSKVLDHWVSRLRHKGKISIGGVDLEEVAQQVSNRTMSVEEGSKFLHGGGSPYELRRSTSSLMEMSRALEARGLKILSRRISSFKYLVTAERP